MAGGNISTRGTRAGDPLRLRFVIEGLDRTTDEFKQARREINTELRDVMQRVGQREALPYVASAVRSKIGERWASSLKIKRERSGVFIQSSLRGQMNRAFGWLDFGGRRSRDTHARAGIYSIVRTMDDRRDSIDAAVLKGLMQAFDPLDHTP